MPQPRDPYAPITKCVWRGDAITVLAASGVISKPAPADGIQFSLGETCFFVAKDRLYLELDKIMDGDPKKRRGGGGGG